MATTAPEASPEDVVGTYSAVRSKATGTAVEKDAVTPNTPALNKALCTLALNASTLDCRARAASTAPDALPAFTT